MKKLKKILNYIVYYVFSIILILGYWGFVKIYYSNFPIFKVEWLDWVSALGIYLFIWNEMDNFRRRVLAYLNLK